MALDQLKSVFTYRFTHDNEQPHPVAASEWAAALAAQAGAHLAAVTATQHHNVSNVMGASLVSNVVGDQNRKLTAAATERAEALRAAARAAGVDADVATLSATYPDIRAALVAKARLYDVVVADAAPDASSMARELLTDMIFHSARPIIIVPQSVNAPDLDHVVLGWDGTAPAARALADAMPLLRAARSVDVVNVRGDKELSEIAKAAALVPHLLRHGIGAQACEIRLNGGDAGQTLLHHAVSTHAGLLVMGAYAHSRFRQMVFGGVTSALLKDCPVPLLMSH
jgi:nucleotide-binding universal stress UspA family protein